MTARGIGLPILWVTFSASVGEVTEPGWYTTKNFTFVEQPTLPAGRYAIVGMHLMQAVSSSTPPPPAYQFVCGRLIVPNRVYRPGALVLPSVSSITPSLQSDGVLGVWETFDAKLPPTLELYAVDAGGDSNGAVTGYLRIIQIGSRGGSAMHNALLERMSTARGALRTVTVLHNTVTELASPSDRRGSITFFGSSGPYTVGLSTSVSATSGIRVPDDSATPVVLTLQQHGDLVQQGFYAFQTTGGALQITYAECIFQGL